ncbi:UDP-Glycosyltransferase/glycogen phosphorylase [Dichomitus squalens LYAD-421 SS1]|uniref:UDP-Glycosyltransferase/glycogen phosphorylase n=1 Tax=Dichomitus squalens (strain LYAD-421) TaxID=732165 RepID=R7STQ4_DICSQ|nr:UDP-Glycosyltransferase/glycogen phosphorylase [Dichomitus squalens LYAD-421 SS1]EJF59604.1 UDP-Glycosyltransferase/glycogen phosphorylase [Dichomitus squalens LYAD-421 SS1]
MTHVQGHIVLLGNGSWPDTKQLCIFATRIVNLRSTHITIFTTEDLFERARREVTSEMQDSLSMDLIRIVGLPSGRCDNLTDATFNVAFTEIYEKLMGSRNFQCTATGRNYGPLPLPRAVVSPNFTMELMTALRKRSHQSVKLLAWYSRAPSTLFFFHGPAERGGVKELCARVQEEAARTQTPEVKIIEKTVHFLHNHLIRVPGYEPIYSHEIQPQELATRGSIGTEWLTIHDMLMACDGVLISTPESWDALSIIGARYWMKETSRNVYAIGPMLARSPQAAENEVAIAHQGAATRTFLDRILKTHGERSLLYISFGCAMWPKHPEKLWTFLDAVMELQIPFILSHASNDATIPQEIKDKVDCYGLGLLSPFCPQQMILNHQATGWFVTQCGQGSVLEAVNAGVPMICWPYVGDEALNAIYIVDTLKIGYELLQIRTGHGLKRIYRTGVRPEGTPEAIRAETMVVLRRAFGQDGAKLRGNVECLRQKLKDMWEQGGESQQAALAFVGSLGL